MVPHSVRVAEHLSQLFTRPDADRARRVAGLVLAASCCRQMKAMSRVPVGAIKNCASAVYTPRLAVIAAVIMV